MTEQDWDTLLDSSPDDPELRMAFAIWLQDEAYDLARAEFHRWLASEKTWPTDRPLNRDEQGWTWYFTRGEITEPAKHATLGAWAEDFMPPERWLYPSRRAAEDMLFTAWKSWRLAAGKSGERTTKHARQTQK